MRTIEHDLVGHASRNPDNISGRKLLSGPALNTAVALFVRRDGFSIEICAAHNERRGARLHEKYVTLRFVPLGLTVGFSADQ